MYRIRTGHVGVKVKISSLTKLSIKAELNFLIGATSLEVVRLSSSVHSARPTFEAAFDVVRVNDRVRSLLFWKPETRSGNAQMRTRSRIEEGAIIFVVDCGVEEIVS